MSSNPEEHYQNDPLYQSAMLHMQNAEWEEGLTELEQLLEKYPLDPELRALRSEMQLRAQVDEDELVDTKQERRRRIITWAIRLIAAVVFITLLYWGGTYYANWFRQQVALARERLQSEVGVVEIAIKFRDGQNLLQAGRVDEAMALFEEVSAQDPDYPGLEQTIEHAQKIQAVESRYNEAIRLINLEDYNTALELLEVLDKEEPNYKDVALRITEIKGKFLLNEILSQAEEAYESEDWRTASSKFETVRALNPEYQPELMEERLVQSYMNAAVTTLTQDILSLEALEVADDYFNKALTLRPQDSEIIQQRQEARQSIQERLFGTYVKAAQDALTDQGDSLEALELADSYFQKALEVKPDSEEVQLQQTLAQRYVKAQDDFTKGRWPEVINELEIVYGEDPEYASGTARLTLYEAYLARGNGWVVSGEYEAALSDYQRAAMLAEQGSDSALQVYEAQVRVAEVQGIMGNYENAVLLYRTAIEDIEISESNLEERPELAQKLEQAASFANGRNYRTAYRYYKDAAIRVLAIFPKVTHVVQAGEYLTMLASRYHTTVEAISQANNLDFSKRITDGQELVIPVQEP